MRPLRDKSENTMPYAVHVPQGFSGRLMMGSVFAHDIDALYTSGSSNGNILIGFGYKKILLSSIKLAFQPAALLEQVRWLGDGRSLVLVFGENWSMVTDKMLKLFNDEGEKIRAVKLGSDRDGIYVSFKEDKENKIHPQVKMLPNLEEPENLLRHPYEQEFTAVQRIEQVIGIAGRIQTNSFREAHQCVFDRLGWEVFDTELTVWDEHPCTKEELDMFSPEDSYAIVESKLESIVGYHLSCDVPVVGDPKGLAKEIAYYLEGYLNYFDHERIFRRNIDELLKTLHVWAVELNFVPLMEKDIICVKRLLNIVEKNPSCYEEASRIIGGCKSDPHASEFVKHLIREYDRFSEHYNARKHYSDLKRRYGDIKKEALV